MIIPWEVDVPQDHRPVMNWIIIAGIIMMFILQMMPQQKKDKISRKDEKGTLRM